MRARTCRRYRRSATAIAQASAETDDRRPQTLPLSIPKPIIAAINGACAGIGLVQALMCDVRFAAEGAKLTTAFARRGLVAEHGISWMLPRLVGPACALDLLLSGRVVFAEEAHALGLVNRVLAPDRLLEATLEYAHEMVVNCSPKSMATMKRQVYADLQRDLPDALAAADRLMLDVVRRARLRARGSRASSSGATRASPRSGPDARLSSVYGG